MADSVGDLLRRFRVAAGLTQEALAERARVSPDTIAALEQGRRRAPRLSTVTEIANALGLGPSERAALANAAAGIEPPIPDLKPPTPPSRRRPLPAPLTPLIGRHGEVDRIAQELRSERLITLVGTGGVGKTRLALQVASSTADKFEGGTWWTGLDTVTDPVAVPDAVLTAVGGSEQPGRSLSDQIVSTLPDQSLLLVIDNCEQVIDAAADLINDILRTPSISILATSREPLGIPGEIVWPVPALAVPQEEDAGGLDSLAGIESVELFVERAGRADPTFQLTEANAQSVASICRRLDGVPLAIELTAVRVRAMGPAELAEEIESRFSLAATTARGVPDRQTTVGASIEWSYQLLSDQERTVFNCLAGFVGTFTPEAASAVAHLMVPGSDQPTVELILSRLVDKSLVSTGDFGGRVDERIRFRLLDSVRSYLLDRASEASSLHVVRGAHADYYVSWLAALETTDPTDDTVERIGLEYPNIRTALEWSISQMSPRAAELVAAFGVAWYLLGRFSDAVALGESALAVVIDDDPGLWARGVGMLALARLVAGDAAFVLGSVPAAAEIARADGDALTEGWCRFVEGSVPPNDSVQMVAAYELGIKAPSATLAAVAAANAATSGADDQPDVWLARMDALESQTDNISVRAACDVARLELWIERGDFQGALDRALPMASDPQVMPSLRMLWVDRVVQIAFQRGDHELEERATSMVEELTRVVSDGGFWGLGLQRLRLALLAGERPPLPTLDWAARVGLQPGAIRTLCRAALDRGERLDPVELARERFSSSGGSLIAASISAIQGAFAIVDRDHRRAAQLWSSTLKTAADKNYLLLVCDSLEAIGSLASQRGDPRLAASVLAAASCLRDETGYRFRFDFERRLADQAWATIGPIEGSENARSALSWREAVTAALSPGGS